MKAPSWLLVLPALVAGLFCACAPGKLLRFDVEITREELQKKIAQVFPIRGQLSLVEVDFSNPTVTLTNGSDRIGLRMAVAASLLGGLSYTGALEADGKINYRSEEKAFILVDPQLSHFHLDQLPGAVNEQIKGLVSQEVIPRLANQPIYHLDRAKGKHLSKMLLKSVRIENGKVIAEMGL